MSNSKYMDITSLNYIKSLSSCPSTIIQGTTRPLTIYPSNGTPPYTLELLVDGTTVHSFPNITTPQTINYTFNESIGTHTYQAKITDSCTPIPITNFDTPCTVTITSALPQPITCPSGQFVIGNTCVPGSTILVAGVGISAIVLLLLVK